MKHFCVALLALLLCVGLMLPVFAMPQSAMIDTAVVAAEKAVGTDTPGAAVVVFESGRRTLFEGYGYADITARTLVTAETSFELGELSALFVALAAQALVEDGKLELDRDIAYYLPAEFTKELNLAHVVTVRDLLLGGGGFAARKTDLRYTRASLCFEELREALLADVPAQINPPRVYYTANAFEIALAAFVVECVAKQSYADFVTERLLLPLGMENTLIDPRADIAIESPATGHTYAEKGVFATAAKGGRTYAALWPADGAISNLADMSELLEFLLGDREDDAVLSVASREAVCALTAQNGVFQVGAAGLSVSDTARGLRGATPHFSAAISFDPASGEGAVVLCNAADSTLLSLPDTLCDLSRGARVPLDTHLYDAQIFEGQYLPVFAERACLIGREKNLHVTVNDDGSLQLGEDRLTQIAPGIFADDHGLAVVQFMLTIEGEVGEVYTADGLCYRPAGFFEWDGVQTALFAFLMVGAIYFLVAGVIALLDALLSRTRNEKKPRAWRFTLPWVLAAVHALLVLLQAFVGASVTSFYTATSVVVLICAIGATVGFVYGLITAFTKRGMAARVARTGILYVLFLLLSAYFGVILL